MKTTKWIAILAMGLAALLAIGCGSSDNSGNTDAGSSSSANEPPKAPSKSEYISKGNIICSKANKQLQKAGETLGAKPSEKKLTAFATDVLVPNLAAQSSALHAIPPPQGDEGEINALLVKLDKTILALKADPELIVGQGDPFAEVNALAKKYGLTACGR